MFIYLLTSLFIDLLLCVRDCACMRHSVCGCIVPRFCWFSFSSWAGSSLASGAEARAATPARPRSWFGLTAVYLVTVTTSIDFWYLNVENPDIPILRLIMRLGAKWFGDLGLRPAILVSTGELCRRATSASIGVPNIHQQRGEFPGPMVPAWSPMLS